MGAQPAVPGTVPGQALPGEAVPGTVPGAAVTASEDRLTRLGLAREAVGMARATVVYPLGFRRPPQRAVARLPVGARPPAGSGSSRTCTTPVVLVPGYLGNRSNWFPLEARLEAAGFVDLHVVSYVPLATSVEALAQQVLEACLTALEQARVDRVHVVGHSLGGLLIRYAAHRLGLAPRLGTAVTIASPHRGAPIARLGRGAVAAALRPCSPLYPLLEESCHQDGVRWVAYYSNSDVVVPARSARLEHPSLRVENVLVPDQGHLSILRAPALLQGVPRLLLEAGPGPADAGAVAGVTSLGVAVRRAADASRGAAAAA